MKQWKVSLDEEIEGRAKVQIYFSLCLCTARNPALMVNPCIFSLQFFLEAIYQNLLPNCIISICQTVTYLWTKLDEVDRIKIPKEKNVQEKDVGQMKMVEN